MIGSHIFRWVPRFKMFSLFLICLLHLIKEPVLDYQLIQPRLFRILLSFTSNLSSSLIYLLNKSLFLSPQYYLFYQVSGFLKKIYLFERWSNIEAHVWECVWEKGNTDFPFAVSLPKCPQQPRLASWSQEPRTPLGSPTWLIGTKHLGYHPIPFRDLSRELDQGAM